MDLLQLFELPPVIQEITWPAFSSAGVHVNVLREDLRHPVLGGNKIWKLKYNLQEFEDSGRPCIVSFGGAYSNHLSALSEACRLNGFPLHVFIRGEEQPVNPRIVRMHEQGTTIRYLSRSDYRRMDDASFITQVLNRSGIPLDALIIPEGANNAAGRNGCRDLGALIPATTNWTACACGTAGTIAGLIEGTPTSTRTLGITVVRSGDEPARRLTRTGIHPDRYEIVTGFEHGGYGKVSEALTAFIHQFSATNRIPLEPVYTGKLFYAVDRLATQGFFQRGTEIMLIHTGGIHPLDQLKSETPR